MSRNIVVTKSTEVYNDLIVDNYTQWCLIPEPVFFDILKYLSAKNILNVGECCHRWNDITKDNYLWKKIFQRDFQVHRQIELKPGMIPFCFSWLRRTQ